MVTDRSKKVTATGGRTCFVFFHRAHNCLDSRGSLNETFPSHAFRARHRSARLTKPFGTGNLRERSDPVELVKLVAGRVGELWAGDGDWTPITVACLLDHPYLLCLG